MLNQVNKESAFAYQPQFFVASSAKESLRRIRNYLAGQVIGSTRDEALLEEVLKCTFCRVTLERQGKAYPPTIHPGSDKVAEQYKQVFRAIQERFPSLFGMEDQISLSPDHILYIDREFSSISIASTHDIIGDVYEVFIGSNYRGQEGQFFTPSVAVKALVALTKPNETDLIIDPACGSGSFLLEAGRYIAAGGNVIPSHLHGIDKDAYLVRLAQLHLALQYDSLLPINCADSLAWEGTEFAASLTSSKLGQFSLVLANPPFGSKIVSLAGSEKRKFALAHNWRYDKHDGKYHKQASLAANTSPQVLFVERFISLLAEGGRMGIVLPESVLSNPNHHYVVQYILEHTTPIAIIGMPESLFKTSGRGGTHTKVCLLVLEKRQGRTSDQIFMAEARWCGHDSRARDIVNDDMPTIMSRFQAFQSGEEIVQDSLGFLVPIAQVRNYVLAPRYYNPAFIQELEPLRATHDFYRIGDLVKQGALTVSTGDEVGKLAYGGRSVPFVRTSDLSNWEIKADPKHLVSLDVYNQYRKKQDVREGDILMVRDGTYLIGTCAFVSKYDTQIVYQSHIYKIRVGPTAPFDNYLLLAMLSSAPVIAQIKSMSFTQDIIDTLGDRLLDLVLPVPKRDEQRHAISEMVQRSLESRIEAREMARLARQAVTDLVYP